MAKDVKFNINLSVIGKNVVAQCKASVEGFHFGDIQQSLCRS